MAIADRFYRNGYEHEFELELEDMDGNPSGLKVWLKDLTCDAAIAVDEQYRIKSTDIMLRYSKVAGDNLVQDVPEGIRGEIWTNQARDKYAACISRWDFNGEGLFSDDEGEPECTYENKIKLLRIPGVNAQIIGKIDEISGFTTPSKEG